MAIKSYELPKVDILNGGGVTNFLVNRGMETAQLPASLLPQLLPADKLLMPDGVTSIAEHYRSFSNRNLLDNWYFAKPINQNGKSEYVGNGYGIDRWVSTNSKLTVSVQDDCIRLTTAESGHGYLRHVFEEPLPAGTYTYSALVRGTGEGFFSVTSSANNDGIFGPNAYISNPGADWTLVTNTFTTAESVLRQAYFRCNTGTSYEIRACKLEPGPFQTLAHKEGNIWVLNDPPPNYALELLKCQRYFYAANAIGNPIAYFGQGTTNNTNTLVEIEVRIPNMRSYPAVSYRGSFYLESENGEKLPVTGISVFRSSVVSPILLGVKTSGTLTKGKLYRLLADDDSNARIIFDSNL